MLFPIGRFLPEPFITRAVHPMRHECLNRLTQWRDDGHRLNVYRHLTTLLRSDELDFLLTWFTAWHLNHLLFVQGSVKLNKGTKTVIEILKSSVHTGLWDFDGDTLLLWCVKVPRENEGFFHKYSVAKWYEKMTRNPSINSVSDVLLTKAPIARCCSWFHAC